MIFAVALAGGVGAALRYLVDSALTRQYPHPLFTGTLCVNLIGSFLLGLMVAVVPSSPLSTILGSGLCGGFTTFSAASVEALRLSHTSGLRACSAYLALTLLGTIFGAACGLALGRLILAG